MADNNNSNQPSTLVNDLNSLDFSIYIGGPMQAAVSAQNAAAMAVVNFIKQVGFETSTSNDGDDEDEGGGGESTTTATTSEKVRYVTFFYEKNLEDGTTATYKLSVPLLTIVPIPSLRIEEMTIDFNAKLNSVETEDVSSSLGASASLGIGFKKVGFKASASYRRTSVSGSKIERSYEMNVHVKVVNDEIPAGLDRILRILESEITNKAKEEDEE